MTVDVLVVGAGPTGLALAAQLHAQGCRVRVVERRVAGQESRAVVVQPRTLEVLEPLGVAATLVTRGDPSAQAQVHAGRRTARVSLARPSMAGTAYPFLLAVPQSTVEAVLAEHLAACGVAVETGTEVTGLEEGSESVAVTVRDAEGATHRLDVAWVVGCDGADSTVRRQVGIPFPMRPYRAALLLADCEVEGDLAPGTIQGFVGGPGICFFFPSPAAATWRLLTVDPAQPGQDRVAPGLPLLQAVVDGFTGGGLRLHDLTWSRTIHLRRGQATRYRARRVLLAGDAAHVHSPAGAQGMNTGIQDAANLGWKLALVAGGHAPATLLDSYEAERWPVARWTRRVTDLAFVVEAGNLPGLARLRRTTAPVLLPLVDGHTLPTLAFRLLGGLLLRHRHSPAVQEGSPSLRGGVHAGDRLPNARVVHDGHTTWLHEVLRPVGLHVLLCGDPGRFDHDAPASLLRRVPVPLHVHHLATTPADGAIVDPEGRLLRRLGVRDAAVLLVRPDGHVGYRAAGTDLDGLVHHLTHTLGLVAAVAAG